MRAPHASLVFGIFLQLGLLAGFGDNDPNDQIWNYARDAARYQGDHKRQTEPEGADAEEFCQSSADASEHAIVA